MNNRLKAFAARWVDILIGFIAVSAVVMSGVAVMRLREGHAIAAALNRALLPRQVSNWNELVALARRADTSSGPIRVIEFGDYQCPACARAITALDSISRRSGRAVGVGFIHFPLTAIHPLAFEAATAAECAYQQSSFPAFHRYLYEHQAEIGKTSWDAMAEASHLPDQARFTRCLGDSLVARRIVANGDMAGRLGINGTPAFAVNGMLYPSGAPLALIEKALRASQ